MDVIFFVEKQGEMNCCQLVIFKSRFNTHLWKPCFWEDGLIRTNVLKASLHLRDASGFIWQKVFRNNLNDVIPDILTFVDPRLIVVTEAAAAAAVFSEESARWRMFHSNVTEDMIICRIDRIPLRASIKCFWSTLTKS